MENRRCLTLFHGILIFVIALLATALSGTAQAAFFRFQALTGEVESNGTGLQKYKVSLYAALIGYRGSDWQLLGTDTTRGNGHFQIRYSLPRTQAGRAQPIFFIEAVNGPAMLASAIGFSPLVPFIVDVNERTTVATTNALQSQRPAAFAVARIHSSQHLVAAGYGLGFERQDLCRQLRQ